MVDIMPGARGTIQGMPVQSLLDMAPAVVAGGAEMQRPAEGSSGGAGGAGSPAMLIIEY